jgi:hypothetical protein
VVSYSYFILYYFSPLEVFETIYFPGNCERQTPAEGCPDKEPEVEENTRNEAQK